MPTLPPPSTTDRPYHITARCNNLEWFHLPMWRAWKIFEQELARVSEEYAANVIAFVLMSNHYHLLMRTPLANIGEIMNRLQTNTSCRISAAAGRRNHLYGGPYKGCLIGTESYLVNVYKYLYRNPVAVGLSQNVEDYPYSTLHGLLGRKPTSIPLHDNIATKWSHVPRDLSARLTWLNTAHDPKVAAAVKKGLRRRVFCVSKKESLLF